MTPKLVEQIVLMRSNKGLIDFQEFREEKEQCSSSDEDEVQSGPDDEVEDEEDVGDNEGDDDGNILLDDSQSQAPTQSIQLLMHNFFFLLKKVETIQTNLKNEVKTIPRQQHRAGWHRKKIRRKKIRRKKISRKKIRRKVRAG